VYKSSKKKDLAHSRICRLLVTGALLFMILRFVLMLINVVGLCALPESEIELVDTGYSYRFEMALGYGQYRYDELMTGMELVSNKAFCIAFTLLSYLTKDLPFLIILLCLRRMLNGIRNSHSPFVPQSVIDTQLIGRLLLLTGFFGTGILQMGIGLLAFHRPYLMNPLEFSLIFAGVVVLLAGDILKQGCELQEFSDETL
jgi:hypothetical protein